MLKAVISLTATLAGLIGLSRFYLGAHWLSHVLGGLSIGVAWIAALAIAYQYQSHEQLRPERSAAAMLPTVLFAGGAHIAASHDTDNLRYARRPMFTRPSRQHPDPYQQTAADIRYGPEGVRPLRGTLSAN